MEFAKCSTQLQGQIRLLVVLISSSMPEMELLWKESSTVFISGWLVINSDRVCMSRQGCWTATCFPCALGSNSSPKDQNNEWDITLGHFRWYECLSCSTNSFNAKSWIQQKDQPIRILVLVYIYPVHLNSTGFGPISGLDSSPVIH